MASPATGIDWKYVARELGEAITHLEHAYDEMEPKPHVSHNLIEPMAAVRRYLSLAQEEVEEDA